MDNFFLLVIAVLFILLAGFLIFYFQTQQSFQEITEKLEEIQHPPSSMLSSETLKRELALHYDKLVLLEADISKNKRESLLEEELKMFDVARHQIKASIAGVKSNGDWVGMPFGLRPKSLGRGRDLLARPAGFRKQGRIQVQSGLFRSPIGP